MCVCPVDPYNNNDWSGSGDWNWDCAGWTRRGELAAHSLLVLPPAGRRARRRGIGHVRPPQGGAHLRGQRRRMAQRREGQQGLRGGVAGREADQTARREDVQGGVLAAAGRVVAIAAGAEGEAPRPERIGGRIWTAPHRAALSQQAGDHSSARDSRLLRLRGDAAVRRALPEEQRGSGLLRGPQ